MFFPKKNKKCFSKESNIGCGVTEVIRDTGRHGVSLSASNMGGNNSIEGSEGYKNCSLLKRQPSGAIHSLDSRLWSTPRAKFIAEMDLNFSKLHEKKGCFFEK